uniref:Cullin_Nedd8 domain-containing protein n=1 Tax=Rhabditophanes sp. KR3021 TaxID=114890 RepID=A0AC35TI32_9BILA
MPKSRVGIRKKNEAFKKTKIKPGHVLKKTNVTDTRFVAKQLSLIEQLQAKKSEVVSYRGLTLGDLFKQMGHHNLNIRRDAVVKIDLTKGTAKVEANKELQTMNAGIESDRKFYLEAIIVRIMKARKEMRHQQLVSDVVGVVKERFKPEISHIKRSIDALIEKDYIKRDANERDLYQYLA